MNVCMMNLMILNNVLVVVEKNLKFKIKKENIVQLIARKKYYMINMKIKNV